MTTTRWPARLRHSDTSGAIAVAEASGVLEEGIAAYQSNGFTIVSEGHFSERSAGEGRMTPF
jgi:hypothetical protein